MERRAFAVFAVIIGLLVGLLANIFFYDKEIGLSFPIFIAVVVTAILALARPAGRRLNRRNLWPIIPMLFFALMIAIRADWMVLWLNLGAVLALGALGLHYLVLERPLDEASLPEQAGAMVSAGFLVAPAALVEANESWAWLRENRHRRGGQFASVVRGSVFAAPVVLVFVFLLGSADAVFANYVSGVWDGVRNLLGLQFPSDMVGRATLTIAFAALMTGSISYALARREHFRAPTYDQDETAIPLEGIQNEKRKPAFKLSIIESTIMLGSVVLLFAAFVVIQFTYFFGGHDNIGIAGLTYAQYARRGFFELVAVSALTLGLALWLNHVTVRQEGRETIIFRALSVALVALTTVMLVSAAQRMWLYEEAFGFTQLRVYTHVAILWLGVLFGVFLLALFRLKTNIFAFGVLLVFIGYLVSLNLLNVDHYIAERNVARYHAGSELDIAFLDILSVDAVPVILPLYAESAPDTEVHTWAGQWLTRQLNMLDSERATSAATVFSWNAARAAAYTQLDAARDSLPAYDPRLYWGSYWGSYSENYHDYRSGWDSVTTTPSR